MLFCIMHNSIPLYCSQHTQTLCPDGADTQRSAAGSGSNTGKSTKGAEYDATGGAVDDRSGLQKIKDKLTPGARSLLPAAVWASTRTHKQVDQRCQCHCCKLSSNHRALAHLAELFVDMYNVADEHFDPYSVPMHTCTRH